MRTCLVVVGLVAALGMTPLAGTLHAHTGGAGAHPAPDRVAHAHGTALPHEHAPDGDHPDEREPQALIVVASPGVLHRADPVVEPGVASAADGHMVTAAVVTPSARARAEAATGVWTLPPPLPVALHRVSSPHRGPPAPSV